MNNSHKLILDLCGGTGAWSKPYRDNGYDVNNITLPHYDIRQYYIEGKNVCFFRPNGSILALPIKNIYGILAAPPCTEFSLAKTTAKAPRDLKGGMEIVIACLNIIWECRYKHKLKFWSLENPRCILRQFLGIPIFTFYHWEFGNFGLKPTDIWGYFNIPVKFCTIKPNNMTIKYPCGSYNTKGWGKLSPEKKAITPQGFANAFFESNK